VERDAIHELTAAYALNALDEDETVEYEAHLRHCDRCRRELGGFQATAASLAFGLEGPAPPAELRDRILVQARSERSNVVQLAPRRALQLTTAAAALAACTALGLGIWAASLSSQLGEERKADARMEQALAVLADPAASHVSLEGAEGSLVVATSGRGALVLENLESLPEGKYYTAWVSRDGKTMQHAGAFGPDGGVRVFPLTRRVPDGGLVAVSVEARPDADQPSLPAIITSARV
jgi:anti-sigma-K factor RskA